MGLFHTGGTLVTDDEGAAHSATVAGDVAGTLLQGADDKAEMVSFEALHDAALGCMEDLKDLTNSAKD